jgi:hypothetical protein
LRHTCPGNARRLSAGGNTRGNIRAHLPFSCADGKACSEPELQSSSCSPVRCGEFFDRTNGSSICSSIRGGSTSQCPKSSLEKFVGTDSLAVSIALDKSRLAYGKLPLVVESLLAAITYDVTRLRIAPLACGVPRASALHTSRHSAAMMLADRGEHQLTTAIICDTAMHCRQIFPRDIETKLSAQKRLVEAIYAHDRISSETSSCFNDCMCGEQRGLFYLSSPNNPWSARTRGLCRDRAAF